MPPVDLGVASAAFLSTGLEARVAAGSLFDTCFAAIHTGMPGDVSMALPPAGVSTF